MIDGAVNIFLKSYSLLMILISSSEIDYEMSINQYGLNQAEQANYQYILEIPDESANLSSSLRFLLENYTYGYNIENIPSLVSIVNIGSYFINRSEKWGIFFAKYNPSVDEFLLGYGPQQITNYYFDHATKYNYGLFLPHSSFFNYLIFLAKSFALNQAFSTLGPINQSAHNPNLNFLSQ